MAILASDTNFADQIAIPAADTPVTGSAQVSSNGGFVLKAHPSNTGTVWVYPNRAGTTKDNGYPLDAGQQAIVAVVYLDMIRLESTVAGQKVCWLKL